MALYRGHTIKLVAAGTRIGDFVVDDETAIEAGGQFYMTERARDMLQNGGAALAPIPAPEDETHALTSPQKGGQDEAEGGPTHE